MVSNNDGTKHKNGKNPGIKIIVVAFAAILFVILSLAAASGMVYVPGLTELMGTDEAVDLGVEVNPVIFDELIEEQGVTLNDPVSAYTLTSNIQYSDTSPMDMSLSSSQLSSYLQATNNDGPLKDIQLKLGNNNQAQMSAYIDLNEMGYNFRGPVYAEGSFEKVDDSSIQVDISSAKVGLLPIPESSTVQGEEEIENLINSHLAKMPGLNIETLEVEDGNLNFKGDFPRTADVVDV